MGRTTGTSYTWRRRIADWSRSRSIRADSTGYRRCRTTGEVATPIGYLTSTSSSCRRSATYERGCRSPQRSRCRAPAPRREDPARPIPSAPHPVLIEVALRPGPMLDRQLLEPRGADAVEHRALHLTLRRAQIDDGAGIDDGGQFPDREIAILTHGDVGDDRDVGVVGVGDREALALAPRTRRASTPARLFGRAPQYVRHLRGLEPSPGAGRNRREQIERERDRIAAGRVGELVDETLRRPNVAVVARRAPIAGWNTGRQFARL